MAMMRGLRTSSRYAPGAFTFGFQTRRWVTTQQKEDLRYYQLISVAGCKKTSLS